MFRKTYGSFGRAEFEVVEATRLGVDPSMIESLDDDREGDVQVDDAVGGVESVEECPLLFCSRET